MLKSSSQVRPTPEWLPGRADVAAILAAMTAVATVQIGYWVTKAPAFGGDAPRYIYIASRLLAGDLHHGLHYHYPPLYPLFLTPFLLIVRHPETAARVAAVVIAMLTVIPIYLLGRQVFNRIVAITAALLWPFKFFMVPLEGDAQAFFNLLLYLAIAAGLRALTGLPGVPGAKPRFPLRSIVLAGAMFGLATLAKIEGQAFFLLWSLFLAGRLLGCRLKSADLIKGIGAGWLGYLAVMSPYLGAYAIETGKISLNPKTPSLFFSYNEPDWNRAWYSLHRDSAGLYTMVERVITEGDRQPIDFSMGKYIIANRDRLLPVYLNRLSFTITKIVPYLLRLLLPGAPLLAGLIILAGIARPGWDLPQFGRELFLVGSGILVIFTVPWFYPVPRFFYPMVPFLVLVFSRGLEQSALRIRGLLGLAKVRLGPSHTSILIALFILISSALNVHSLRNMPREEQYHEIAQERRELAVWVLDHLSPDRRIISMWEDLPLWYLAGLEPERDLSPPLAPIEDLLEYAHERKVEYIIVNSDQFAQRYPELGVLLRFDFRHPGLERVSSQYGARGRYYYVYQLK